MAKYRVTAPDGQTYEITAPEGASEQDVLAYAQQQFQQQAAPASGPKSAAEMTPDELNANNARLTGTDVTLDPTAGNSFLQNFTIGAGKSVADTGRGLAQIVGRGPSPQEVEEQRRLDAPLMNTGGGIAGNVAGAIAQMAIPVGGGAQLASVAGRAAPYIGAAGRGAAFAGAQAVGDDESRLGNAAAGGALGAVGQGVASGMGAVARGVASRLDAPSRELAQRAQQLGIKLGVGDLSNNQTVRTVINQMERLPFSGGRSKQIKNQEAFNELLGADFGAKGKKLTPDVFAAAKKEVSDIYNLLADSNRLQPSPQMVAAMRKVADDAKRLGSSDAGRITQGYVDDIVSRAGPDGTIPGQAFKALDSEIGTKIKGGGNEAFYLGQLRSILRAGMDDSISPLEQQAWKEANRRWAALKTVEPLVAKSPTGDISPQALMGAVTSDKAGKVRMATDKGGPQGELARIGSRFMKAAPDSGTADRAIVNAALAGGLYGAQKADWITPEQALLAGGTLTLNRALLKALSSRGVTYGQSPVLTGLARASKVAPRALPAYALGGQAAAMDIGNVTGYDPNDPRYRGD